MRDENLQELVRAVETSPGDTAARIKLERAWLRVGLGWFGEKLPSGDVVTGGVVPQAGETGERRVYSFTYEVGGRLENEDRRGGFVTDMVYVRGGETPCDHRLGPDEVRRVDGVTYTAPRAGIVTTFTTFTSPDNCPHCRETGYIKIKPFYLGRFPVTNAEWLAFYDGSESHPGWRWPDDKLHMPREKWLETHGLDPVVNVTQDDAVKFCEWAGFRLPTATEWVWAAFGAPRVCTHGYISADPTTSSPERIMTMEDKFAGQWRLCSQCIHGDEKHVKFPWGNDPTTPERSASACPSRLGASPVVVFEEIDWKNDPPTHPEDDRLTQPRRLVPARPAGASWCGAMDLYGNVEQRCAGGEFAGTSFRWPGRPVEAVLPGSPGPHDTVGFRVVLDAEKVEEATE